MDQHLRPDEAQYIQEFIETLRSTLDDLVGRYKTFNQDTSCEEALTELNSLDSQVSELNEKIKELCVAEVDVKSIDRDQEHLINLQEEIGKVIIEIKNLKENVDNINSSLEKILPDYSEGDYLEITEIKNRIKHGEMIWFVSIKSNKTNKGYFRNVEIVEEVNKSIVGKIQLIQPGTEVTIKCYEIKSDSPRLFAQVKNDKVSEEFAYFPIRILSITLRPDNTLEVQVKNLSEKKFENNYIVGSGAGISDPFDINPCQAKSVQAVCQHSQVNCLVWNVNEKTYMSSAMLFQPNFNYETIVADLTEEQKRVLGC